MSALKQSLAQTKPQKAVKKPVIGTPPVSAGEPAQRLKVKKPRAGSVRTIAQSQRKMKAG